MNLHEAVRMATLTSGNQRAHDRSLRVIRTLLADRRHNVNRRNRHGKTALNCAAEARCIDTAVIKMLLEHGADPNIPDTRQETPLHNLLLNRSCSAEAINLLLQAGADVSLEDRHNNSALGIAALNPDLHPEAFRSLLLHCPDDLVDKANDDNMTPLSVAVENDCCLEVVQDLVRRGADVNMRHFDSSTLLHVTVQSCTNSESLEIMRLLLRKGIDMDAQNTTGDTALHTAVLAYYDFAQLPDMPRGLALDYNFSRFSRVSATDFVLAVLHELLTSGASLSIANRDSYTPLDHALLEKPDDLLPCPLLKMLVKHLLLQNFDDDPGRLLHPHAHARFVNLTWLVDYFNSCVSDIQRMRGVALGDGLSLFDFVSKIDARKDQKKFTRAILDDINREVYPVYGDLVKEFLSVDALCGYVQEANVRLGTWEEIYLDVDTMLRVSSFLEKDELFHVIFASLFVAAPVRASSKRGCEEADCVVKKLKSSG